ncbi:hypothetical protein SAMN05421780_10160 [Flexibacter flexilis DSM 6793]|uniref:TraB/GumN family protein n=1 Tax=Flexibacter flexilis DSM 6793 TaxID=927664 RepID=A0A1I1D959_9BACT|nr:DUF5694 domain-containing protein [Flexibacter flexilis]SFB71481.1 hypothetical protein SAMN05421780_10160 [Flexibacter flexilis DSM 6793]
MKIYILSFAFLLSFLSENTHAQQAKKPKEVLLIGTFHFNNPGADLAKTDKFDVMSEKSQKELEAITSKIKAFAPDKVFVEWDYNEAAELDSLYALYMANQYFDYVAKKYPKNAFFKENEIFQLAFRIAKSRQLPKVYGIDIKTDFAFDSLLVALEKAQQTTLKDKIFERIKEFEQRDNTNRKKYTLTQLILESNKQSNRNFDLGSYITLFNPAGKFTDLTGADLVASWYRRNLLMYSFVQKITEQKDDKIVVLLGASHIALFKQFIDLDENYKVVELKDILAK